MAKTATTSLVAGWATYLSLAVLAACIGGCASMNVEVMAPDIKGSVNINRSVRVVEVTGSKDTVVAPVANDKLREAILVALKRSAVFGPVMFQGESDLDLKAVIISQAIVSFRPAFRREIVVAYEFVDRRSLKTIFRENIQSEAGSAAFGGYNANVEAGELSVRENLLVLLSVIAEKWPAEAR